MTEGSSTRGGYTIAQSKSYPTTYSDGGDGPVEQAVETLKKRVRWVWIALAALTLTIIGLVIAVSVVGAKALRAGGSRAVAPGDEQSRLFLTTDSSSGDGLRALGTFGGPSGSWVTKTSFPLPVNTGISDGAAVVVGSVVYHVGGHIGTPQNGNAPTDQTFLYDPLLDTFTDGPTMPVPVARGAAATDGASVFYVGGVTPDAGSNDTVHLGGPSINCLFQLNTALEGANASTWKELPCMPTPRSDLCAAWVGGKLYAIGGYDAQYNVMDTIEEYNPGTGEWATLPLKLPAGRGDLSCAVLGQEIYVAAGVNVTDWDSPMTEWFTGALVSVDVARGTVTERAHMPYRRGDVALVAIGSDELLAMGGEIAARDGSRTQVATSEVARYLRSQDAWVPQAPLPGARFRAAAATTTMDGSTTVLLLGGHHRCESAITPENPDGGCDEIASVVAFLAGPPTPTIFVYEPNDDFTADPANSILVSPEATVQGYTLAGALASGSGYWAPRASLPMPRSDFHAVAVDSQVLLVGGLGLAINDTAATVETSILLYDPLLDTFRVEGQVPQALARQRYVAGWHEGKFYMASGINKDDQGSLASLVIFDRASGQTTQAASMKQARSDACGAMVDGKLYVVGGFTPNFETALASVEIYDPATDSWSEGPPLPVARGDCAAAALGSTLYVAGGYHDPTGQWNPDSFAEEVFALSGRTWVPRASLPVQRGDMALVAMEQSGRLLAMGGETHARGEHTLVATHGVHEYHPDADMWVSKAPMPTARFRFSAVEVDGGVYAFGGHQTCKDGSFDTCSITTHSSVEVFFDANQPPLFWHVRA